MSETNQRSENRTDIKEYGTAKNRDLLVHSGALSLLANLVVPPNPLDTPAS